MRQKRAQPIDSLKRLLKTGPDCRVWRKRVARACALLLMSISTASFGAPDQSIEEILDTLDPELIDIGAQIEAQEFAPAIATLERRIRTIEQSSRYDPGLVAPLTLLGDAQAGAGDYDGALDSYGRAVHINRVNDGLISPKQVDIVYREAEVYKTLGNYREANNREDYAYHVLEKSFGPFNEKLLPGVYHLAAWYKETYNIYQARSLYERAVQILESNNKHQTHQIIPALAGIAATYRLERFPPFLITNLSGASYGSGNTSDDPISVNNFPAGERALQRIVLILKANPAEDSLIVAEAVLELADWNLLWDRTNRAFPLYEHAYELLVNTENVDVEGYFAEPKLLYYPSPRDPKAPALKYRGAQQHGYVEIGYRVSTTGHVRSLTTIASEPEGLMDFRVRKSVRYARYRPVLVAGIPIISEDNIYRHEFDYFPRRTVAGSEPQSQDPTPIKRVSDE
ncbi:MAG: hypothetical protein O7E57_03000 [Gammaproteobacteria bacterium]|nr:hypothetical protein [Gammaproteobacteria bacterium]